MMDMQHITNSYMQAFNSYENRAAISDEEKTLNEFSINLINSQTNTVPILSTDKCMSLRRLIDNHLSWRQTEYANRLKAIVSPEQGSDNIIQELISYIFITPPTKQIDDAKKAEFLFFATTYFSREEIAPNSEEEEEKQEVI